MTLQVTDQASGQLKALLDQTEHEPDQIIRLHAAPTGDATLTLDVERDGDQVIDHEGDPVMVVDNEVSEEMDGVVLDINDGSEGVTFTLRK